MRVYQKLNTSIKTLVSVFPGVLTQELYHILPSRVEESVLLKALKRVPGIFIKTNHKVAYQREVFDFFNSSSSLPRERTI